MNTLLTKEDLSTLRFLNKRRLKEPSLEIYVASKRGGNNKGIGRGRSVILAQTEDVHWYQIAKCWGENNRERAYEIVRLWKEQILN